MLKRWHYRPLPQTDQVNALATSLGVRPTLAALLVQRGITHFDQAKSYFRPSLDDLHDPFTMKDMDKAVHRLGRAIEQKESILVYGDYDVDGVTSVAMFYGYLKSLEVTTSFYIPDRYREGYGVSMQAIEWAAKAGFKLIVSLDCGIKATDCIQEAKELGIDVIVCDHHDPGKVLPNAYAILNPKQPDCPYATQELSGCGVGFKLLQALTWQCRLSPEIPFRYLDLVAISIACDLVPIVGENRILVYHGLQKLNTTPQLGLKALMEVSNLLCPLVVSQLVFGLGPRINASGRIDHAKQAVQLLLTVDSKVAITLAQDLDRKNDLRRDIDQKTTQEALAMIESDPGLAKAKTTVLFKKDWHKGVIGIVASRCIEQYYRPTIILTASHGKATGSARSVAGYNIQYALQACADLLDQYGGHAYAAGLTLPLAYVTAFQKRFEEVVTSHITDELLTPTQDIDLPLSFGEIDWKFYNILDQMAPFGNGNMQVVFATDNVLAKSCSVLKGQHLRMNVYQSGTDRVLGAIGFGLAHYESLVRVRKPFRIAYTIEKSSYLGKKSLQLNIKDLQAM